jgi:hypothetical protein
LPGDGPYASARGPRRWTVSGRRLAARTCRLEEGLATIGRRERRLADDYARHVDASNEERANIAALALARDRERAGRLGAELRKVEAAAASEDNQPADELLDFNNELSAALTGALGAGRPLLAVNAELRQSFSAFLLDKLPDGRVAAQPVLAQAAANVKWAALGEGNLEALSGPFPMTQLLVA